jgi:NAD(P)-dependent dehydrogenase (short-subunit alcohol dehydrogenase family)
MAEATLLGRVAEPHQVAGVIGFLASPRARYITGTTVAVDGGRTGVSHHRQDMTS